VSHEAENGVPCSLFARECKQKCLLVPSEKREPVSSVRTEPLDPSTDRTVGPARTPNGLGARSLFVRGATLWSRMWREVGRSAAAGFKRITGSHVSSDGATAASYAAELVSIARRRNLSGYVALARPITESSHHGRGETTTSPKTGRRGEWYSSKGGFRHRKYARNSGAAWQAAL
jgi:hypothetical protein